MKLVRIKNINTCFISRLWAKSNLLFFKFKMSALESFIRGFMFNMYRGHLAKERYFIALGNR